MAKVLLVEDDKFLVRGFEVKLKKEGFQTLFMENGVGVEEAVKKEKKIYIHCKNGHGRGPTVVAAVK